jgi:DDE domain
MLSGDRGVWIYLDRAVDHIIEQDYRGVKARIGPMLGFKRYRRAKVTIASIELLHRIRKNQFNLGKLPKHAKTAPAIGTRCSPHDPCGGHQSN